MLREGADPMAARRAGRSGAGARAPSLRDVSAAYWQGRGDLSERYVVNAERGLAMHVFPALGDRACAAITRDDVMAVLNAMNAAGRFVYLRRVHMWLAQVLDYAVEHGHATANAAAGIRTDRAFGRRAVVNMPALALDEVPEFWSRLELENPHLLSVLACKLLAHTWTRTAELRGMRWDEVRGDTWTIPGRRMKKKLDHVVPLNAYALDILGRIRAMQLRSDYVFPAPHRPDRPMSENAVLGLLYRIGYKGRMSGHGWRSVGSTWANERAYRADVIERQLAHVRKDKVRAVYNRAEYLTERRALLEDWGRWLEG
jgi:integrase